MALGISTGTKEFSVDGVWAGSLPIERFNPDKNYIDMKFEPGLYYRRKWFSKSG
jgi:hypothetical protein